LLFSDIGEKLRLKAWNPISIPAQHVGSMWNTQPDTVARR
jgi:hypothetical protein